MTCAQCRAENREGVVFCEDCGAQLPRACPRCGAAVLPEKKFCGGCGMPQAKDDHAPRSYTPPHIAQKILTSRSALEGERKQVTVLFCDVVDSSRLAEQLDPEAMHEIMDRVLRLMAEAVHRYEGTVNQFLGDGLMALFGAPAAIEDHAVRGVESALAIQETISGFNEQLKQERNADIRLRIGLNTGLVVVGRIGDDLRMDYTAIGDTTHLAHRMQTLAAPGTILMTETTRSLVEGYVHHESLGPLAIKGRTEPVVAYRVTGRRRWRTRLEVSAERGLTELVGRHAEMQILQDCFARVKAGRGAVVGVVGEPGAGKSRLIREFRKSLEAERIAWLEGQCLPYGPATPLLPIREMLRTDLQIEEGVHPLQVHEKLRLGLQAMDAGLLPMLPFLAEVLGVPDESGALDALDPKERGQKTFEAIRALTVAASQRRPQILVFEDLHWIDRSTENYLFKFLVESLPACSILLLTSHRPGYSVRWSEKTYYTQLSLDLLNRAQARQLISTLLGTADLPDGLTEMLWEKAEGNPLFIEELVRSLRERGLLVERDGRVQWLGAAAGALPHSVQDIIRARIDRLEGPVKQTLLTAAAIGREFTLRLLGCLAEPPEVTADHLETLKRLELVHQTRFFPEIEYGFKHAIIQEVAYEGLLSQPRKELHGRIARAIEEVFAGRLEDEAWVLAYHYARSASPDLAIDYAILAGDRAARIYANAEATTHFNEAILIARSLPASAAVERREIDATLKLAATGTTRQDVERDQKNLQRALQLAKALNDEPRLARVLYWLGRTHYVLWNPNAAIDQAQESLDIAERLKDETLAAPPVNLMGRVYLLTSQFVKASQMLERSVTQMRQLGNRTEEATAAGLAGTMRGFLGDFPPAFEYVDYGITLAGEIANPFAQAAAWYYRGTVRDQRGEWALAIADYDSAVQWARTAGDPFREYIVKCWQGRAYVMAGDPLRGRQLIEESMAISQKIGTKLALSWQHTWLAGCLLALGEIDGVPALCEEAIKLADAAMDRFNNALAHRTLGEALARLDSPRSEAVERAFVTAMRIWEEIGARPEQARTEVSYARLLMLRGHADAAQARLARARGMLLDMGMEWDVRHAEQALSPRS